MFGIDLNKPLYFKEAFFRHFDLGEHHINRVLGYDVLLLVFDGVLCFEEDGTEYTVTKGEYHIQKANSVQTGNRESLIPKYLYVHFSGNWTDVPPALPKRGNFNPLELMPLLKQADFLSRNCSTQIEKNAIFFQILSSLFQSEKQTSLAEQVAEYLQKNFRKPVSLEQLSAHFHFSPNHIINQFKKEYGVTPFTYIRDLKMSEAEDLLQNSSKSLQNIAMSLGYNDYAQFYKTFFSVHNISPLQYRYNKTSQPF